MFNGGFAPHLSTATLEAKNDNGNKKKKKKFFGQKNKPALKKSKQAYKIFSYSQIAPNAYKSGVLEIFAKNKKVLKPA